MSDNTTKNETTVLIPGEVYAKYVDGKITKIAFMPHGSNAGYRGPSAVVSDGDENLDVEETDGPFWTAVQSFLAGEGSPSVADIVWEE